jgi:hypothetical protein
MGVDFYRCPLCHENYPDCGSYFECEVCPSRTCGACERAGKFGRYYNPPDDEEYDPSEGCPFCNLTEVHDNDLMEFALAKLGMTEDQLREEYIQARRHDE